MYFAHIKKRYLNVFSLGQKKCESCFIWFEKDTQFQINQRVLDLCRLKPPSKPIRLIDIPSIVTANIWMALNTTTFWAGDVRVIYHWYLILLAV